MDLNSDIGESYGVWRLGDDARMLELVTSANIACGFHAGDPTTLRWVCELAAHHGVSIGAQVSYPDLLGFGRRHLVIDASELRDIILYQLGALAAFARAAGSQLRYVKPHGALYHAAAKDPDQARAVLGALSEFDSDLAIVGLADSVLLHLAEDAGIRPVREAFADRAYLPDGGLVSRSHPGAVLTDPDLVAKRVVRLVTEGTVEAIDGTELAIAAETICVHGDTPGAVEIARRVLLALEEAGISPRGFVGN